MSYLYESKDKILMSESSVWGPEHQWCVCSVWSDSVNPNYRNHTAPGWYDTSWLCQDDPNQWWPRAFSHPGNPLNPNYPSNYDAFYHYAVSQVGPINIGDQIVFDTQAYNYSSCSLGDVYAVTKICFVYRGHYYMNPQTYTTLGAPPSNPVPGYNIHRGPCCESFPNTSIKTSWDCVQIGDHPKFGYKCVEIQGIGGQYPTKTDCINSPCSQQVPQNPDPGMPGGGPTLNPPTP